MELLAFKRNRDRDQTPEQSSVARSLAGVFEIAGAREAICGFVAETVDKDQVFVQEETPEDEEA